MSVDLHLHTHYSDGTWSPTELVQHAIKSRLRCIAITDHDTTAGINEAMQAAGAQIDIVPGLEINTVLSREDGTFEDIHILGHWIDPDNSQLQKVLKAQQEARAEHLKLCLDAVVRSGVNITLQNIQDRAGLGTIGKAHITQAIVDAGGAKDAAEAYRIYMSKGSPHYVQRKSVDPQTAIEAIRGAGGVASIAHPGKGSHMDGLIQKLRKQGLQGIEAYHRIHSLALVKHYIRLAHECEMLITGGSDCHGPFEGYPATVGSISVPFEVVDRLKQSRLKAVLI